MMASHNTGGKFIDDNLSEQIDRWATFILANMLWVLLAIFLVTLPAATAGLCAVMSRWVRGKRPELFQTFFGAARRTWLTALLIGLLDLLVGGLLVVNLSIFPMMGANNLLAFLSQSATLFAAAVLGMANLYLWPLMVLLDLSRRQLIGMSLKLVFAHPIESAALLAAAFVPVAASLLLPRGVFVVATASCVAFIVNWGAWRILRPYLSVEDLRRVEWSA